MIRPATVADLEALLNLEVLCFAERRFDRGHLMHILTDTRSRTFAYVDGGVVGSLMVRDEGSFLRVTSLGVHPRRRRRGIGRVLMAVAEDLTGRLGLGEIRLEVNTRNAGAIAFYGALGYTVSERLPKYYSWGDDAFAMRKPVAVAVRKS